VEKWGEPLRTCFFSLLSPRTPFARVQAATKPFPAGATRAGFAPAHNDTKAFVPSRLSSDPVTQAGVSGGLDLDWTENPLRPDPAASPVLVLIQAASGSTRGLQLGAGALGTPPLPGSASPGGSAPEAGAASPVGGTSSRHSLTRTPSGRVNLRATGLSTPPLGSGALAAAQGY
jgi:hypothetical protein